MSSLDPAGVGSTIAVARRERLPAGGARMIRMAAARLLAIVRRRRSIILCHHGVGVSTADVDPDFLQIAPAAFRAQLELMLSAGYDFVTVAELAELADGGVPPPGYCAISFDDGMEDNRSVALPILQEYGIPATVYVATGLIGQANPFLNGPMGGRMMTEAELREMAAAGIEIGAHTVNHTDLATMDRDASLREMVESRATLEQLSGTKVRTFAYPFCRYGPDARAAAADAGFLAAVTCDGRGSWNALEMKRTIITGKDGLASFVLKLTGLYKPLFDSLPGRVVRSTTRDARARVRAMRDAR